MGDILGVAKISNIFFWVLEIPDSFLEVNDKCWARAYGYRVGLPPPPPLGMS